MSKKELLEKLKEVAEQYNVRHAGTCPSCGHCPTCGRRSAQPYAPTYPHWTRPIWTNGGEWSTTVDSLPPHTVSYT